MLLDTLSSGGTTLKRSRLRASPAVNILYFYLGLLTLLTNVYLLLSKSDVNSLTVRLVFMQECRISLWIFEQKLRRLFPGLYILLLNWLSTNWGSAPWLATVLLRCGPCHLAMILLHSLQLFIRFSFGLFPRIAFEFWFRFFILWLTR